MKAQLYFANLKRAITGTTVGSSQALDVNVVQTASATPAVVKETRFHDTSSVNINNSGGAFVQIATAANIANTITQLAVNCTFGEPVTIRKGANAGAAAANPDLMIVNQGASLQLAISSLVAGDKIWVRSLSANAITSGYLVLNLLG